MSARIGDMAAGGGFVGEVVGIAGDRIEVACLNEHGRERRIVTVPSDDVSVVKLAQEWKHDSPSRIQELDRLWDAAREQGRERERGR